MPDSIEAIREEFESFAEVECGETAPFYRHLARGVAAQADLLRVAGQARPGARRANLFFAAVNYLVLSGGSQALAALYARADRFVPGAQDPFPEFLEFCERRRAQLSALISTRLVQTNEVQRCAYLVPGFAAVERVFPGRPLALLDVGSSAGLHLLYDRFAYRYSDGQRRGNMGSPVVIDCEVRGTLTLPLSPQLTRFVSRLGLDLDPIDPADEDACRWLVALVWPEQPKRVALLKRALELAAETPPTVLLGSAVDELPRLVGGASGEVVPVIHHSHVLAHFPAEERARFCDVLLPDLGAARDLAWLRCEGSTMDLVTWRAGEREGRRLAKRDPHGAWIEWLDEPLG